MPATLDAASPLGRFAVDRGTFTIRFMRALAAPRAQVFEVWTMPEHVRCWWDPEGAELASCEIDLRPGGRFTFISRGHPEMPFSGIYREIAPPERLVFDANGAVGRVMLAAADDDRTQMVVEIACQSAEQLDQYIRMGVDTGTNRTLDNLVAYCKLAQG